MERLDKPEAKGILAFLGSTPPKSAEDAEKERKEREKASAEKRAEVEHKRSGRVLLGLWWPKKMICFYEVGALIKYLSFYVRRSRRGD